MRDKNYSISHPADRRQSDEGFIILASSGACDFDKTIFKLQLRFQIRCDRIPLTEITSSMKKKITEWFSSNGGLAKSFALIIELN